MTEPDADLIAKHITESGDLDDQTQMADPRSGHVAAGRSGIMVFGEATVMTETPDAEILLTIHDLINNGDQPCDTIDEIAALLVANGCGLRKQAMKCSQYIVSINFNNEGEGNEGEGDLVIAAHTIGRNYRVTIDFSYDKTVEINEKRVPRPRDEA